MIRMLMMIMMISGLSFSHNFRFSRLIDELVVSHLHIHQLVNQALKQSVSWAVSQSISQLVNLASNQSVN